MVRLARPLESERNLRRVHNSKGDINARHSGKDDSKTYSRGEQVEGKKSMESDA